MTVKRLAKILGAVIAAEVPFLVLLNQGPHSEWGFLGYIFFTPSMLIVDALLGPDYPLRGGHLAAYEIAVMVLQTSLLTLAAVGIQELWRRRRSVQNS